MKLLLFLLISISSFSFHIKVENIKDKHNPIFLAIYNSEKGFPYKYHLIGFKASPLDLEKGIKTDLPSGEYSIVIFQDKNHNNKLDKSFFGKPKEPIGVSRIKAPLKRTPKFNETKVYIDKNDTISIILWE